MAIPRFFNQNILAVMKIIKSIFFRISSKISTFILGYILFSIVISNYSCGSVSDDDSRSWTFFPTYTIAWIDGAGKLNTMESTSDGPTNWEFKQQHDSGIITGFGPTVVGALRETANDIQEWILVWTKDSEIRYKIGYGSISEDSDGRNGILWGSTSPAIWNRDTGRNIETSMRPTLAFGDDKWVIIFREKGQNGRVMSIVRDYSGSSSGWGEAIPINPISMSGFPGNNFLNGLDHPSLTYFNGEFVLAFNNYSNGSNIAILKSVDGKFWTSPGIVQVNGGRPTISKTNGQLFISALTGVRIGDFFGKKIKIFRSSNGTNWNILGETDRVHPSAKGAGMTMINAGANNCLMLVAAPTVAGRIGTYLSTNNSACNNSIVNFGPEIFLRRSGDATNETSSASLPAPSISFLNKEAP